MTFGSADSAGFTFDANTGRITQYKATINGRAMVGDLTWNANGTLKTLGITDPFNSADTQTCNYTYDDLARIASAACGTPWSQTFTYDAFGNVTKSGSIAWQPGYNASTNRYTLGGTSYDAKGNLTADTFHTYTWDVEGRPASIDALTLTYDALGRMVEENNAGVFNQYVYALDTKIAVMKGQTMLTSSVPLPGGTIVKYVGSTLSLYRFPDWLGSIRAQSTPARVYSWGLAFAPFGEGYAISAQNQTYFEFAGNPADTATDLYDSLYREEHTSQGRWVSPDPAGLGAVDPSNPQTWNRYAYVQNGPLNSVDPTGLMNFERWFAALGILFGGDEGCTSDGVDTPCAIVKGLIDMGAAAALPPGVTPSGVLTGVLNGIPYGIPYIISANWEGLGIQYFGCNAKAAGLNYCNNEGYAEVLGLPTFVPSANYALINTDPNAALAGRFVMNQGRPTASVSAVISAVTPPGQVSFQDRVAGCAIGTLLSAGPGDARIPEPRTTAPQAATYSGGGNLPVERAKPGGSCIR